MTNKYIYNKRFKEALNTCLNVQDFKTIKNKNYFSLGIDYWNWLDFLANLEIIFKKDLTETSEKFKIETIEDAINAIYKAPNIKGIYKN